MPFLITSNILLISTLLSSNFKIIGTISVAIFIKSSQQLSDFEIVNYFILN